MAHMYCVQLLFFLFITDLFMLLNFVHTQFYLNDIGEKLLSLSRLFADDTSLGYSSQNVVEIENVINHDLCELNTWSTKWLMSFNPDKTEIMLFSNTDVRYNFNFTFNGNNIPITTSHKHLGVTLSSDAKWNNHIENIILNVSRHFNRYTANI